MVINSCKNILKMILFIGNWVCNNKNLIINVEAYRSGHNEAVLKTVCLCGHGGSNPSASAKKNLIRTLVFGLGFSFFISKILKCVLCRKSLLTRERSNVGYSPKGKQKSPNGLVLKPYQAFQTLLRRGSCQ